MAEGLVAPEIHGRQKLEYLSEVVMEEGMNKMIYSFM